MSPQVHAVYSEHHSAAQQQDVAMAYDNDHGLLDSAESMTETPKAEKQIDVHNDSHHDKDDSHVTGARGLDAYHTYDYTTNQPICRPLAGLEIEMLRDHAGMLHNTNAALNRTLAEKNSTLITKNNLIERKQRKVDKLTHEVQQLEEIVEQKTRINREKQRNINNLLQKAEKAEEELKNFKLDTAELILQACHQIRVATDKSNDRAKAQSTVEYYRGFNDAGAGSTRVEQIDATHDLREAKQNEAQANRILNECLSELFDLIGINMAQT